MRTADLKVDFAQNKFAFKIAAFGTPVSPDVAKLTTSVSTGSGPSGKVLEEFIRREFPSFFVE